MEPDRNQQIAKHLDAMNDTTPRALDEFDTVRAELNRIGEALTQAERSQLREVLSMAFGLGVVLFALLASLQWVTP